MSFFYTFIYRNQYLRNLNQVISYYDKMKELLEENIQTYISLAKDPAQQFNKDAYDYMLHYFGLNKE